MESWIDALVVHLVFSAFYLAIIALVLWVVMRPNNPKDTKYSTAYNEEPKIRLFVPKTVDDRTEAVARDIMEISRAVDEIKQALIISNPLLMTDEKFTNIQLSVSALMQLLGTTELLIEDKPVDSDSLRIVVRNCHTLSKEA